jgi:hypothetical protein
MVFQERGPKQIALVIPRCDVETNAPERTLATLQEAVATPLCVERFEGSVSIYFDGYESDLRELWRIPECVRFFGGLDDAWPHWLHFIAATPNQLGFVLRMIVQRDALKAPWSDQLPDLVTWPNVQATLARLFGAMNKLHAESGLSEDFTRRITMRVGNLLRPLEA